MEQIEHLVAHVPSAKRAHIGDHCSIGNSQLASYFITSYIVSCGKPGAIDTARDDLDRPAGSIFACLYALRKQYRAGLFSQDDKTIRLFHRTPVGALCSPVYRTALRPYAGVGIFLGKKSAYVVDDLWLVTRQPPCDKSHNYRDQHAAMNNIEPLAADKTSDNARPI